MIHRFAIPALNSALALVIMAHSALTQAEVAAVDVVGAKEASGPAATSESSGFEHGLRLGATLPLGKADGGNALRNSGNLNGIVGIRVPIWLDLGYRVSDHWWLGLAPELGLGSVGSDCDDDQECEWSDLRLAAQAIYTLSPGSSLKPWIGLGLGWEWLRGSVTLTVPGDLVDQEQDVAVKLQELLAGPQLFAQGGLQFEVGEALTLGPYLSAAAGMYVSESVRCPAALSFCPSDSDVEDKQVHAWLGLGVRGTHGP